MQEDQARALAKLFASKFISRPDVMAIQTEDGEYRPTRDSRTKIISEGFSMPALLSHINGSRTLGHYMTNQDDQVKLFAFDVDLEQTGSLPGGTFGEAYINWKDCNPREAWISRKQGVGRDVTKIQMRMIANKFTRIIQDELGIPVAVAYSGSKGMHIYGFTGPTTALRARAGAKIILEAAGWSLIRGQNFYGLTGGDPLDKLGSLGNFSIEVYPKQDTIEGKDLGNLMRLPLGVNRKSPKDKTFFIDLRAPISQLVSVDPIEALTTQDPWRYAGE